MAPALISTVKVELMRAWWTLDGGAVVNLGVTKTGSKVKIKRPVTTVKIHELGETPINLYGRGVEASVELMLEAVTIENLNTALGATLTTVAGPPEKKVVDLDPRAGIQLPFGVLILHPFELATATVTRDWKFYRAQIEPDFTADYQAGDALTYPLKFIATPTQDGSTGKFKLLSYGDPTAAIDFDAGLGTT